MRQLAIITLALLSVLPLTASAQWSWIDKEGRRVFSDRAPPGDVPEKDIRKRPGQAHDINPASVVPTPAASAAAGTDGGLASRL